jgi:hypothetical protein
MRRYFFHVQNGVHVPDDEGTEIATLNEAKCEAVKLAGQLICDAAASFWDHSELNVTVSDDAKLTLFSLHLVGIEAAVFKTTIPA